MTERDRGERGRAVGGRGRKWKSGERQLLCIHSSFNLSPYLKAFHLSNHPSIHPSIHSFSQQAAMHPFIPLFIDAAASPPSHLIMHPSFYPSFHFPFHLAPHHLSISPSLHLYLTLSLWLSSFIYIGFLLLFREHSAKKIVEGGCERYVHMRDAAR